jgi:hypothetical protein
MNPHTEPCAQWIWDWVDLTVVWAYWYREKSPIPLLGIDHDLRFGVSQFTGLYVKVNCGLLKLIKVMKAGTYFYFEMPTILKLPGQSTTLIKAIEVEKLLFALIEPNSAHKTDILHLFYCTHMTCSVLYWTHSSQAPWIKYRPCLAKFSIHKNSVGCQAYSYKKFTH